MSLRVQDFRRWFLSQLVSSSGTMTQGVALAWLVLKLSDRGVDLGALSAFAMLPVLVGAPFAGGLVDRFDKRRLLVVTQSTFLVLALALGLLTSTGAVRLWMVFLLATGFGVVGALDGPARQLYVLDLVGVNRAASAISLNEVVLNVSRVLGPAVGGALVATVGVATCFYVNAATFVLPLVVLAFGSPRARTPAPVGPDPDPVAMVGTGAGLDNRDCNRDVSGTRDEVGSGAWASPAQRVSIARGVAYAWGAPVIRYGILMAGASGMVFNLGVALPLVATRTFDLGAGGYAVMMVAFGLGAIAGAGIAGAGSAYPSTGRVRGLALATGASVLLAASMPALLEELVALAATGLTSIWFVASANTLVQLRTDAAHRGRVMGLWVMALPGLGVLTGPLTGWVAQTVGPREAFGLGGVALFVSAVAAWRAYGTRSDLRPTASVIR